MFYRNWKNARTLQNWENSAVLTSKHESYNSKERLTGNGEIADPADAYVN